MPVSGFAEPGADYRPDSQGGLRQEEPRERERGVAAGIDLRLVPLPCLYIAIYVEFLSKYAGATVVMATA